MRTAIGYGGAQIANQLRGHSTSMYQLFLGLVLTIGLLPIGNAAESPVPLQVELSDPNAIPSLIFN